MVIAGWDGRPFGGAKVAALHGEALLVYRRDRKPDIPWPGLLDLPGGGREGAESPAECGLRELAEEFGLALPLARIHYLRAYPGAADPAVPSFFLALHLTSADIAAIRFGNEGEDWQLMTAATFLAATDAVPYLQQRLADYRAVL